MSYYKKKKRAAPLLKKNEIKHIPIYIDEYDDFGNLKFNLKSAFHKDIQLHCGLYLMTFSNGMFYVGQTNNIYNRLTQHYLSFLNPGNDWHKEVYKLLKNQANFTGKTPQYEYYKNVKLQIQYTSTVENAKLLEKMALNSIYNNGFIEKYYNTEYFLEQNNGGYKRIQLR